MLTSRVGSNDVNDGPGIVLNTPGLPLIGSTWAQGNDNDPWAFCWPECSVSMQGSDGEAGWLWLVTNKFSTKPFRRCQDLSIENPLAEPPRVRGGFSKRSVQGTKNRAKRVITSSAHTPIKGKETEFEDNRPTVSIEITSLLLPLNTFGPMIDNVNDQPLWGVPKRCIKLSNATWQRLVMGRCGFYYVVNYEFDVNYDTFDRDIPDASKKVLAPLPAGVTPDTIDTKTGKPYKDNPKNFIAYIDRLGHNSEVFLDGKGRAVDSIDDAYFHHVEYYEEANFLLLGVPATF
jgi:hypothetical protein